MLPSELAEIEREESGVCLLLAAAGAAHKNSKAMAARFTNTPSMFSQLLKGRSENHRVTGFLAARLLQPRKLVYGDQAAHMLACQ